MICPFCHRDNPDHSDPSDPSALPQEGDISICFGCASIGIFTDTGEIRKPTEKELTELLTHDNIIQAQKACLESAYVNEALTKAANPKWTASDLITEVP